MKDYIIVYTEYVLESYVTNKSRVKKGIKKVVLTDDKIRAKFYRTENAAQKFADKLSESNLYPGTFYVEELKVHITCK